MPDSSDNYQLPSWPPTPITQQLWNAVMGSIGTRLTQREELEATFEALQQTGIQASLDYIQVTIAPQIATLQSSITLAQEQLDQIILDGVSPDSNKLGGELPSFYVPASRTVAGKPLTDDVTLDKADVGLDQVDNTPDSEKPVSQPQQLVLNGKANVATVSASDPTAEDGEDGDVWYVI